jgi:Fe-S-cluster-containing hydrogenase component 2
MTEPIGEIIQLQRSGVIVVDESLCLTCRECEVACSLYHERECNPSLSRIRIEYDDFVPGPPSVIVCKQCDWPACLYACASRWDESAVQVDEASGARRSVIGFKSVGRKRVYLKCDLCYDRPDGPVCVQICPGNALTYVPAEERRG